MIRLLQKFINSFSKKKRNCFIKTERKTGSLDQEFKQRNMEEFNEKNKVGMNSSHLRGGKTFSAEQKICELKKLLLSCKRIAKFEGKCIKPNELIKKQRLI